MKQVERQSRENVYEVLCITWDSDVVKAHITSSKVMRNNTTVINTH